MGKNTDQVNSFLEREYARTSRILRNGELFSSIQNEEANTTRTIENLKRTAEHQQMQQSESIKRKYQVKIDGLQNLQNKLMMYGNNPSMLKSDDISRISSMLGEMHQLLESQKNYEIETSDKEVEARSKKSIEDYSQRSQMVIEKHFQDAKSRLEGIMATYVPFEEYYETASFDSHIWSSLKNESVFPIINQIRLGETKINIETQSKQFISYKTPEIVPFFNQRSLTIIYRDGERDKLKNVVDNILSRCLMSAEAGNIQFHFMDGNGNGSLFFDYLKCSNKTLQLFDGKINITPQEIESSLQKLQLTYKEIDQKIRKGESITQYNKKNPNATLPYHIIVMDSFPRGISSSLSSIMRLMNDELAAGLHFVFLVEEKDFPKVTSLAAATSLYRIPENYIFQNSITEFLPKVLSFVDENYSKEKTTKLREYVPVEANWWQGISAKSLQIPFGLSLQTGDVVNLTFDRDKNAAIIIGGPGQGKSVLLHTLIINAAILYSPDMLQMFLIDFSGAEFGQYIGKLPHAKVIAPDCDQEYGLSILELINNQVEARKGLFKKYGTDGNDAKNFEELQRNAEKENVHVPRLMLIIDEFHKFFDEKECGLSTRRLAGEYFKEIVKEYSKYGVNIILATQQLMRDDEFPYNLLKNRIAYSCEDMDFRKLTGMQMPAMQKGECFLNTAKGNPKYNAHVQTFFSTDDDQRQLILQLKEFGENNNLYEFDHIVYRADELPDVPMDNSRYVSQHLVKSNTPSEVAMYIGQSMRISQYDLFISLKNIPNDNVLVIGGYSTVAQDIAMRCIISAKQAYNPGVVEFNIFNFNQAKSEDTRKLEALFSYDPDFSTVISGDSTSAEDLLSQVRTLVENRRPETWDGTNLYLALFAFERSEIFRWIGFKKPSGALADLIYILEYGPSKGVHTILQVSDLDRLFDLLDFFNHRVVLFVSDRDSRKLIGNEMASTIKEKEKDKRGYLFNVRKTSLYKFRPYKQIIIKD